MDDSAPRRGPGAFQWNAGGWFGSQIGSTCWLLLAGPLLIPQRPQVGIAVFACGLIPNLIGLRLWQLRHRVEPYPAIQSLLLILWGFTVLAVLVMDVSGAWLPSVGSPPQDPARLYWFLLMFPGLMLVFHLQERAARRHASEQAGRGGGDLG